MENSIVPKYFDHQDFAPKLDKGVRQICREYGFDPTETVSRRYIYSPDKLWRVRIKGVWQKLPAMLRIENLRLETDEEEIRQNFRAQSAGSNIRPPETYVSMPFDPARGYAFSIEEYVDGEPLFDPSASAENAWSFVHFYRELNQTVRGPFWPAPESDARSYSVEKMSEWYKIAMKKFPERTSRLDKVLSRLMAHSLDLTGNAPLRFQHAHLTGNDVRKTKDGQYVVFANHFWRWGQPGYDVAFPMWSMWLSLPPERRKAAEVRRITDFWLMMTRDSLDDLVSPDEILGMLLNRLYGALLIDVPTRFETENFKDADALDKALQAESERILEALKSHSSLP